MAAVIRTGAEPGAPLAVDRDQAGLFNVTVLAKLGGAASIQETSLGPSVDSDVESAQPDRGPGCWALAAPVCEIRRPRPCNRTSRSRAAAVLALAASLVRSAENAMPPLSTYSTLRENLHLRPLHA